MSSTNKSVVQRWKPKATETAMLAQNRSISREEEGMVVCPQHLRFTQDSISNKFKPPFQNTHIQDSVIQIRQKLLSPAQMPPLNVVKHNGILWSLDNRRLWVFRVAKVEEIRVNLVPTDLSRRSTKFFNNLNADIEKLYSSPTFSPRVRGGLRKIYVKTTGAGVTVPSLPIRSQQEVTSKSTASDVISIKNDSPMEYCSEHGFEREGEGGKPRYIFSRPDRLNGTEITGAFNVSSFPKLSPEAKVTPSLSAIPKSNVINTRDPNPYVPLLSSEKEVVIENRVIRYMKKLFYALHFGTRKVCCVLLSSCMPCLKADG